MCEIKRLHCFLFYPLLQQVAHAFFDKDQFSALMMQNLCVQIQDTKPEESVATGGPGMVQGT
jgi:hypothetical protein